MITRADYIIVVAIWISAGLVGAGSGIVWERTHSIHACKSVEIGNFD